MPNNRQVLAVASGVAGFFLVAVLGIAGIMMRSVPDAEANAPEILDQLAQVHTNIASGALALDPASKANADVLASDAIPEKAAPNFFPKHVNMVGATRMVIAGTNASVVAYSGEEGPFEVISVKTTAKQVVGAGVVPFGEHRFLNGARPNPAGEIHMVGVRQGSRITFLVGTALSPKLAELARMLPE